MNHCKIVEDLMPLYIDNLVSLDTAEYVNEHLKECPACSALYEQLRIPVSAEEAPDYKKPLWLSILRIAGSAICLWTLTLGIFGYLMWEVGWFAPRKRMEAPDGVSYFEVVYKESAGFFADSGGYIATPNGKGRDYTGDPNFVDCHVWWAPNSQSYFLWVEFTDRNLTSYWGYDGPDTYTNTYDAHGNLIGTARTYDDRFYPREENFFEQMTAMLRERGKISADCNTVEYEFGQWREDSTAFSLLYFAEDGQSGTVWFSILDNEIISVT